jgi:transcriptional antiterminator RfaH
MLIMDLTMEGEGIMRIRTWFAIHTRAGREQEAAAQLRNQGFEVYLPTMLQRISHARRIVWQPRAFLPGYLFVHLAAEERRWTSIRSTRGVITPVRFGAHYPAIDEAVIAAFRGRENDDGHIEPQTGGFKAPFREGQRVRVLDGAMADLEGVFACMRGEERALVFMQLLQRQVQVTVDTAQLAAA